MPLLRLAYQSKVWIPVRPCQEVAVCLVGTGVEAKMASGQAVAFATIENTGRRLKAGDEYLGQIDPRDAENYQYELTFNTADFAGGQTLMCEDLGDIAYPACIFRTLFAAIP